MATLTGITIVKRFTYRGDPTEEFSNKYWFKGAPPGAASNWDVVRQDLVAQERLIYPTDVSFVRVYGYDDDASDANHVYVHDYTDPGPPPTGSASVAGNKFAGDQAACMSWKTDQLNKRGKPIYLRKYLHAGWSESLEHDSVNGAWAVLLDAYATFVQPYHGGMTNATSTNHAGGTESVVSHHLIPWVTTRTLKRRGPRPKTGT